MNDDRFEAVWGADGIGKEIKRSTRQTFYLLESGVLPARKVRGQWQTTKGELRDFLLGVAKHPARDVA